MNVGVTPGQQAHFALSRSRSRWLITADTPPQNGVLAVAGHHGGSTVTVQVSVPDLPPTSGEEVARGTAKAQHRNGRLAGT